MAIADNTWLAIGVSLGLALFMTVVIILACVLGRDDIGGSFD